MALKNLVRTLIQIGAIIGVCAAIYKFLIKPYISKSPFQRKRDKTDKDNTKLLAEIRDEIAELKGKKRKKDVTKTISEFKKELAELKKKLGDENETQRI